MKMVICKDDFFPSSMANFVEKGTEIYLWRYGQKSLPDDKNKFFVCYLWDNWLEAENNFYYKLWIIIQSQCMPHYECWRIMANGQVEGQNGTWHKDDNEDDAKT